MNDFRKDSAAVFTPGVLRKPNKDYMSFLILCLCPLKPHAMPALDTKPHGFQKITHWANEFLHISHRTISFPLFLHKQTREMHCKNKKI